MFLHFFGTNIAWAIFVWQLGAIIESGRKRYKEVSDSFWAMSESHKKMEELGKQATNLVEKHHKEASILIDKYKKGWEESHAQYMILHDLYNMLIDTMNKECPEILAKLNRLDGEFHKKLLTLTDYQPFQ